MGVGGAGVAVGGTGVAVGGTGVAVGGNGVAVGGGGTAVNVGGSTGVAAGALVAVGTLMVAVGGERRSGWAGRGVTVGERGTIAVAVDVRRTRVGLGVTLAVPIGPQAVTRRPAMSTAHMTRLPIMKLLPLTWRFA